MVVLKKQLRKLKINVIPRGKDEAAGFSAVFFMARDLMRAEKTLFRARDQHFVNSRPIHVVNFCDFDKLGGDVGEILV